MDGTSHVLYTFLSQLKAKSLMQSSSNKVPGIMIIFRSTIHECFSIFTVNWINALNHQNLLLLNRKKYQEGINFYYLIHDMKENSICVLKYVSKYILWFILDEWQFSSAHRGFVKTVMNLWHRQRNIHGQVFVFSNFGWTKKNHALTKTWKKVKKKIDLMIIIENEFLN